VYTRVHTPRRCGQACKAGLAVLKRGGFAAFTHELMKVGTRLFLSKNCPGPHGNARSRVQIS